MQKWSAWKESHPLLSAMGGFILMICGGFALVSGVWGGFSSEPFFPYIFSNISSHGWLWLRIVVLIFFAVIFVYGIWLLVDVSKHARAVKQLPIEGIISPGVKQPDTRLMESLNRARVGAERLLKLKADTIIEGRLVYTPNWETILDIETTYRSTSERLALARSNGSTEYVARINSLITSLQRGKSILDMYKPEKDMSLFKDELNANSNEIVEGVDDIFRFLLEPTADTNLPPRTRQGSPPVIGIDAEDSIIDAPGAKIKNQDIGVRSRKSIINIPDSEIKDERRGKENR